MKETTRTVGAFDLAEDAVRLVQSAPRGLIVAYYVGSLPFVMGLLYFWADMSQSAFAYSRCATSALGVALLFVWMKTWQAIYGRGLLAFVARRDGPPLGKSARTQDAHHSNRDSGMGRAYVSICVLRPPSASVALCVLSKRERVRRRRKRDEGCGSARVGTSQSMAQAERAPDLDAEPHATRHSCVSHARALARRLHVRGGVGREKRLRVGVHPFACDGAAAVR